MDWQNERWIKVYVRDSAELIALTWEARALMWEVLRKLDRTGRLDLGRRGAAGLSGVVRMPVDVVARALAELTEEGGPLGWDGPSVLCAPSYAAAQHCATSPAIRQAMARDSAAKSTRIRSDAQSRPVTPGDARSTSVTRVEESRAEETPSGSALGVCRNDVTVGDHNVCPPGEPAALTQGGALELVPSSPATPRAPATRRARATPLPADWRPTADHSRLAVALGLDADVSAHVELMRDWSIANGKTCVDWSARLRQWIRSAAERPARRERTSTVQHGGDWERGPVYGESGEVSQNVHNDNDNKGSQQ